MTELHATLGEIITWYDGPQLAWMTCVDGVQRIGTAIPDDDGDVSKWPMLVVDVSDDDRDTFVTDGCDLLTLIQRAPRRYLGVLDEVRWVLKPITETVKDEWLPEVGVLYSKVHTG